MGITCWQMVEILEEKMDYRYFCVLEDFIEMLFYANEKERKEILEKLKKEFKIKCKKLLR